MPAISVRTRGDRATMTVTCTEQHRVTVTLDGTLEFGAEHNAEHDAVMRALGAPAHPCQQAAQAYRAADTIYRALIGERDTSDYYANQRHILRSHNPCPTCPVWRGGDVSHFHACNHQAHLHETETSAVYTLVKWMVRNSSQREYISAGLRPAITEELAEEYQIEPYSLSPALFVTEPFLRAATKFAGEGSTPRERTTLVSKLRGEGIKVQWLTSLTNLLTPTTLRRIATDPISPEALIGARNIAPEKVAQYINAGITANFYTYAKVDARPEDVLSIYRATNKQHTLAADLRAGRTIPDALSEALPLARN